MASLGQSLAAIRGGALFFPKGVVMLDGQPIKKMTGIFPGALVQTLEGSGAIVLPNTSAVIAANSQVGYNSGVFDLWCGVLTVAGNAGSSVRASAVTVFPASREPGKFHVARLDGTLHVIAVTGALWINTGGRSNQLLQPGLAASFPDSSGCKAGN